MKILNLPPMRTVNAPRSLSTGILGFECLSSVDGWVSSASNATEGMPALTKCSPADLGPDRDGFAVHQHGDVDVRWGIVCA